MGIGGGGTYSCNLMDKPLKKQCLLEKFCFKKETLLHYLTGLDRCHCGKFEALQYKMINICVLGFNTISQAYIISSASILKLDLLILLFSY